MLKIFFRQSFSAFIVCLLTLSVAVANTQLGAGLTKCSRYNELSTQAPLAAQAIDSWTLGYLSGVSFVWHTAKGVDLLADQNSEKIVAFVQGYCKASPAKSVGEAANEYWF